MFVYYCIITWTTVVRYTVGITHLQPHVNLTTAATFRITALMTAMDANRRTCHAIGARDMRTCHAIYAHVT